MRFIIWEKFDSTNKIYWKIPFYNLYVDNFKAWCMYTFKSDKFIKDLAEGILSYKGINHHYSNNIKVRSKK